MIDGSADLYNHLPQITEVRLDETALRAAGRAVGSLIESSGAADFMAISVAHRHFTLEGGEVVAWRDEDGDLRLRPRPHVVSQFVPVAWTLSQDRTITPVEYAFSELVPAGLIEFLNSPIFPKLQAEVLARLHISRLSPNAGISLTPAIFSSFFPPVTARTNAQVYEESFDQVSGSTRILPRVNGLEGLSLIGSMSVTTTMWSVRGGTLQMLAGCAACCSRHC
jgi:hypothetical protein